MVDVSFHPPLAHLSHLLFLVLQMESSLYKQKIRIRRDTSRVDWSLAIAPIWHRRLQLGFQNCWLTGEHFQVAPVMVAEDKLSQIQMD